MTHKGDYEDWRKLFQKEQNGKNPEDILYRPVQEIEIAPYADQKTRTGSSFTSSDLRFSHTFLVDHSSAHWLSKLSEKLKQYQIKTILSESEMSYHSDYDYLRDISSHGLSVHKPESEGGSVILDFYSPNILPRIKHFFSSFENKSRELWITPGDDFLWNTALYRGIRKHLISLSDKGVSSIEFCIYIPLQKRTLTPAESQLIPLSNQFLSMMVSGINHCIWDIRNACEWQVSHLIYLLNVPEILEREGNILTEHDPIYGSDFFEELSDKVVEYLQEIE